MWQESCLQLDMTISVHLVLLFLLLNFEEMSLQSSHAYIVLHYLQMLHSQHVGGIDSKICSSWNSSLWETLTIKFMQLFFTKTVFSALFHHTGVFRLRLILWVRIWLWHTTGLIREKITPRFHLMHFCSVMALIWFYFAIPPLVVFWKPPHCSAVNVTRQRSSCDKHIISGNSSYRCVL